MTGHVICRTIISPDHHLTSRGCNYRVLAVTLVECNFNCRCLVITIYIIVKD